VKRILLLISLLVSVALGQTSEEARQALDRGDWKTFKRFAERAAGVEGRLARARLRLVLGRPDLALTELDSDEPEVLVVRMEALCEAERYTEARELLRTLEEARPELQEPYDFRFYIYRGVIERRSGQPQLAEKNFRHALTLAGSADQECFALDNLVALWLGIDDLEKANEHYLQSSDLIDEVESVWVVGEHFETGFFLEYQNGSRASSASLNRACHELYKAHENPVLLADSINNYSLFSSYSGEVEKSFDFAYRSLQIYLEEEDYPAAVSRLRDFKNLYYRLAQNRQVEQFERLFEETISRIPQGSERALASIAYAEFLQSVDHNEDKAVEIARSSARDPDQVVSTLSHTVLGSLYQKMGRYREAREEFEAAAASSPGQLMRADRFWRASSGPVTLSMAELEKARHNDAEALVLVRRALEQQPGDDWRAWRIDARYQGLMIAVDAHDKENSLVEMRGALQEIEQLRHPVAKAGSFTNILAALLLNQSVGDDVIEPAQFVLGEYSGTASAVVLETFQNPELVSRYISYYDQWQNDAVKKKEKAVESQPAIFKGLLLEALGALDEAEMSVRLGLQKAEENDSKPGQMVGRVLLARIALRSGNSLQAAEHMTQAADIAQTLNPLAARFYLLSAGAVQRDVGQLRKSVESFTKAIELNKESSAPGYFGRALTYERMGLLEEAGSDIDRAVRELDSRERTLSLARARGVRARILATQGKRQQALESFKEAYEGYSSGGTDQSLERLALDYSNFLQTLGREREALQILTVTLDKLSTWQALSHQEHQELMEETIQLALILGEETTALRYLELLNSTQSLEKFELSRIALESPESQELVRELAQLKERMNRLQAESTNEQIGRTLADTRQQFFTTLNRLRESEPDFESLVQLSGSQLSSIQELLSPDSILLEYFPARTKLYIFAVTAEAFTVHEVVVSRDDLTLLVQRHLAAASRPGAEYGDSEQLYSLLLGPVKERLTTKTNLRVVPSGPLWQVSFSSLMRPGGEPMTRDFEVSYLTSSDLARIRRSREKGAAVPRKPLLVGGTDELAGVDGEIDTLARKMPNSEVLRAEGASVESFLQAVEGRDLIHIASHSRVSQSSGYVEIGGEHLTLEQIYGLELEPSSLVVLSSCLSGAAVGPPGKEITSLASAFSVAGASTVVASRWEVDDRTAAQFFDYFYQGLLEGRRRGEAFREAELQMSKRYSHPYYWAGFSLFGDPD